MGEDVLIFAVLTTGAVLIISHIGRLLRASLMHRTLRDAISRDNASIPALLEGIKEPTPGATNDDRTGMVLVALAVALFLFGVIQGDPDDLRNLAGASLFPLFVGVALLVRYRYARRREQQPR